MQTRLSEIIENIKALKLVCPVEELMYVKSELNIADLGTRNEGRLKNIGIGSEWQVGPAFLTEPRELWPIGGYFVPHPSPKEEVKLSPQLISCSTTISPVSLIDVFKNSSNKLRDVEFLIGKILYNLKIAVQQLQPS